MTSPRACPSEDTISDFASGHLTAEQQRALQEHLDECADCHALLGELARMQGLGVLEPTLEEAAPSPDMQAGQRFDTYILRCRLAAGGMGEVWIADDPGLQRPVALKLLLPGFEDGSSRLLHEEAQALAKLAHPHVVVVFDAGEWAGRGYFAMEYVMGVTLAGWLAAKHLTIAERLDALIQAGRGLAAVHQAGLVHRDFKPSNVLVGADGRVRLGDFGLARFHHRPHVVGGTGEVTVSGIAGTPAYLAPELREGGQCSPASDQYAFCVSLYEALYGHRPRRIQDLAPPGPGRWGVPRRLHAIIQRGLNAKAAQRFPSMEALLDALSRAQLQRRRWRWGLAAGCLMAFTAASTSLLSRQAIPCGDAAGLATRVWNAERARRLARTFEDVGGAFGRTQWERTAPLIDDYIKNWTQMRRDSCEATFLRHEQSDALFDRRVHCLDRRLAQLDTLLAALSRVSLKRDTAHAPAAALAFPSLEGCKTSKWLADEPPPSASQSAPVQIAFRALDEVRALSLQSRYKESLVTGRPLLQEAEEIGYAPLTVEVAYEVGSNAYRGNDLPLAAVALGRCGQLAATLKRPDRLFDAQVLLMRTRASANQVDAALASSAVVAQLAELSEQPLHPMVFQTNLGAIFNVKGDYAEAAKAYRSALARIPVNQQGGLDEAKARQGLGIVLTALGEYEDATLELQKNVALREKLYGPKHPLVAFALDNLGSVAFHRNDVAAAKQYWQRALSIQETAGSGEFDISITLGNLAIAQDEFGEFEAALDSYRRAIALSTGVLGRDHPLVARQLANQSGLLAELGRFDEAEAAALEALAIRSKTQPADHPEFAQTYSALGHLRLLRGLYFGDSRAHVAALEPLSRAIATAEGKIAPSHTVIVESLARRSRANAELGRRGAAKSDALRAYALIESSSKRDGAALFAASALARVHLQEGHVEKAEALLAPRLDRTKLSSRTSEGAFLLATVLARQGRWTEAAIWIEQVAKIAHSDRHLRSQILAREVDVWLKRQSTNGRILIDSNHPLAPSSRSR